MTRRILSALLLAVATACASQPAARATTAGGISEAPSYTVRTTPIGSFSPAAPLTDAQRRWVDSTLATLSLRDRVGQMVMVWVLGDYTSNGDSSFAEVRRWIEQDHVGGVSMSLGTPIEVAAKINAMQRIARVPLIASADLEPGLGRLEGGIFSHYLMDAGSATVFPSNMAIGATGRDSDAYDVGRAIGQEARAVGIEIDFAPVVDINNNPNNPVINTRSFGEDPQRVARLAALFVKGVQESGAVATAKHFPGHGDTDVDSHVGLPVVGADYARLDTVELVPFRAAIAAGAGLVMTAHIALPAIEGDSTTPATLAPRIITGLLRDTLGFRGVAITDAMTMEGVGKGYTTEQSSVLAIQAGADILLKPTDPTRAIDAIVAAVERGDIRRARIDSAARHVLELKARTGVAFHPLVDLYALRDVVGSPAHRALAADVARRAVTLLRDRDRLVPARGPALIVQYAPETELKAGRVFGPELRAALPGSRVVRISPSTDRTRLDSIAGLARGMDRVIVAAYVRRIEGEGRFAMAQPIAAWIDSLAQNAAGPKVAVVAYGNPYLIRQFPHVGTYLVTYGVSDDLERATAGALAGRTPITGRSPISLPGFFQLGDGIRKDAADR
ncbi:MAG TPA: glycoside hydrolase family 3 N-terminal domain-containing protein [Gemmatimonadaceae bacterium]|nr:glycoside hydrolase family 3 N-terminal domain-containing protein [Gemmatimonadaceae bacterium]